MQRLFEFTAGLFLASSLAACVHAPPAVSADEARKQVEATERAFAKSMADRDHAAFTRFLSSETVFFNGQKAMHGKQAVADAWMRFFEQPQPPFSWEPDAVEVLESGTLALSTGPVRDADGKVFARFNSIWRLEAPGQWRIVFDKGERVCDCDKKP